MIKGEQGEPTPIERTELGSVFDMLGGDTIDEPSLKKEDIIEEEPEEKKEEIVAETNPPVVDPTPEPAPAPAKEEEPEEIEVTNDAAVLAEYWKQKGFLPDDYEITEDLTREKLEEAYRTRLKEEVVNEMQMENAKKYNPQVLETAEKIVNGYDPQTLDDIQYYDRISKLDVTQDTDEAAQVRKDLLIMWYEDKGFSEEEAVEFAENDISNGKDIERSQKATKDFGQKAVHLQQEQEAQKKAREDAAKKEQQRVLAERNKLLDKGVIANTKYTKDQIEKFRNSMDKKTETYTDPTTGKRYRVTLFEKRKLEIQNDPELALKNLMDFVLGVDTSEAVEKVKTEAQNDMLSKLGGKIVKKTVTSKEKPTPSEGIKRVALT